MRYIAIPRHSLIRRTLFTLFYLDQLKSLIPVFFVIMVVFSVTQDASFMVGAFAIAYLSYTLAMRMFIPYYIIMNLDCLDCVVAILDNSSALCREEGKLKWKVKVFPSFIRSKLDYICIKKGNSIFKITGRKCDIKPLADILNEQI